MWIFIDESGSFKVPEEAKTSVSCVAALVVPEGELAQLESITERLRLKYQLPQGELKGRSLAEVPISDLVTQIARTKAILVVAAIDLGLEAMEGIESHRDEQARMIQESAKGLQPAFNAEFLDLAVRLPSLSSQLYAQLVVLTELVRSVVQTATLEYSQSEPETLGAFHWVLDAKDQDRTEYESLWVEMVKPMLQTRLLRSPMITLRQGDYSHFERFENPAEPEPPDYLRDHVQHKIDQFDSFNARLIMDESMAVSVA